MGTEWLSLSAGQRVVRGDLLTGHDIILKRSREFLSPVLSDLRHYSTWWKGDVHRSSFPQCLWQDQPGHDHPERAGIQGPVRRSVLLIGAASKAFTAKHVKHQHLRYTPQVRCMDRSFQFWSGLTDKHLPYCCSEICCFFFLFFFFFFFLLILFQWLEAWKSGYTLEAQVRPSSWSFSWDKLSV